MPIAAYPYLLENGIDPRMVEQQIEKSKVQASQAPSQDQGQPSPEQMQQMAMAMQQGQGMAQQPMVVTVMQEVIQI